MDFTSASIVNKTPETSRAKASDGAGKTESLGRRNETEAVRKAKMPLNFDPRIKLVFILAMSVFTFAATNTVALLFLFLVALYFQIRSRRYTFAAMSSILYLIVLALDALVTQYVANNMLQLSLGMFTDVVERLIPTFMIAAWAIDTTEISELISALQNMRVPKGIVISLAVTFRFVPTVQHEFWYIRNTMKLREVSLNWKNLLRHPIATMEYSLVPLLMRSMRIGEDLAASALTRGLDRENPRTSHYEVRLRPHDFVGLALFFALALVGLQLNNYF